MSTRRLRLIVLIATLTAAPRARANDWPSFALLSDHTRLTPELSGAAFGARRWLNAPAAPDLMIASPAVADGFVVTASFGGVVRAIRATDGREVWNTVVGAGVHGSPAIDRGRVIVPAVDQKLVALRLSDGAVLWKREFAGMIYSSPTIVDGTLLVAVGFPQHQLLRVDAASGRTIWQTGDAMIQFSNAPPIVSGGQVVLGTQDGTYYAFDLGTGAPLWSYEAKGTANLSAAAADAEHVYFAPGGTGAQLHGVSLKTGTPISGWPVALPDSPADIAGTVISHQRGISSIAAVGGYLVLTTRLDDALDTNRDGNADLYLAREIAVAFDASTGALAWQIPTGRAVRDDNGSLPKFWLCPAPLAYRDAAGRSLVLAPSSLEANLRVLDLASGEELARIALNGPALASPVLANGHIVAVSRDGAVEAFPSSVNAPPEAPIIASPPRRPAGHPNDLVLGWRPSFDPDRDTLSYEVRFAEDGQVLTGWSARLTTEPGQSSVGLAGVLTCGTTYTAALRARDPSGALSPWSQPLTFVACQSEEAPAPVADVTPIDQVASAVPGDAIRLPPGRIVLSRPLEIPAGVAVVGAGPGTTVLDGKGLHAAITVRGTSGSAARVEGLTISGAEIGIEVAANQELIARNVIIRDNSVAGIDLAAGGIVRVYNGTFYRNEVGVKSEGTAQVKNSVLTGHRRALWATRPAALTGDFNALFDNGVDLDGVTGGASDLRAGFSFVDPEHGDFHAQPGAATIDRGDPTDDFRLEPAPNGGRINMGAFGGTAEAETASPSPSAAEAEAPGCQIAPGPSRETPWWGLASVLALAWGWRKRRTRQRAG